MKLSSGYIFLSVVVLSAVTIFHLYGVGGILAMVLWALGYFAICYDEYRKYLVWAKEERRLMEEKLRSFMQETKEKETPKQ